MPFRYPEEGPDYGVGRDTIGRYIQCGWALRVRCDAGHERRLGADWLANLPSEAALVDVVARLKCECGQRDGIAYAINSAKAAPYGPPPREGPPPATSVGRHHPSRGKRRAARSGM